MKNRKRYREYGTEAQGPIDDGKVWLKVPDYRMVEIDKAEMNAVLAKYRKLGIRITEEKILLQVSERLREIAFEDKRDSFTDEQVFAFWDRYRRAVLRHTPETITDLAGFDPRILSRPCRKSSGKERTRRGA